VQTDRSALSKAECLVKAKDPVHLYKLLYPRAVLSQHDVLISSAYAKNSASCRGAKSAVVFSFYQNLV
jgi:hypothetical protein